MIRSLDLSSNLMSVTYTLFACRKKKKRPKTAPANDVEQTPIKEIRLEPQTAPTATHHPTPKYTNVKARYMEWYYEL